jgi:hypothetical protein
MELKLDSYIFVHYPGQFTSTDTKTKIPAEVGKASFIDVWHDVRKKERDRERKKETERQGDRETAKQRDSETERGRERNRDTGKERETDRERERVIEKDRKRESD